MVELLNDPSSSVNLSISAQLTITLAFLSGQLSYHIVVHIHSSCHFRYILDIRYFQEPKE